MESISTIGLDIAKSVFQVHAISEAGEVVVRRQLNAVITRPRGFDISTRDPSV